MLRGVSDWVFMGGFGTKCRSHGQDIFNRDDWNNPVLGNIG